jgi:hypothetical protein
MTGADRCFRYVAGVNPRAAARFIGIARVAIGSGLLVAPRLFTPMWVGRRGLTLAARDVGIGAGALAGRDLRPWLLAGIAADATDLAATVIQRDDLPATAVPLVVATAGAGIVLGAYALTGVDS